MKLVIALGANIPSKFGNPITTLSAIRPEIEKNINEWNFAFNAKKNAIQQSNTSLSFNWSPLFETNPVGGPENQPTFINAVLVVDGNENLYVEPSEKAAIYLMNRFLDLENAFGREREYNKIYWGPRVLDIDFISWGELQVKTESLVLPHPRFAERNFVLIPLAEILSNTQGKPRQIKFQENWPE